MSLPDDFQPPSLATLQRALAPLRTWFDPRFFGLDALDLSRPALFVGNHGLFSIDAPLMIEAIYREKGVLVRALGDHMHFRLPGWGRMVRYSGGVDGTPENCAALMRSGQSILVFPGGAREVMRRKSDGYRLIWKQRTGFARLAIRHGYDIIPFAAVGANETYRILADADDIRDSRAWRWLDDKLDLEARTRGGDLLSPLVRGVGPTLLPRPERFYFGFGDRISTTALQTDTPDSDVLWQVRRQTERAIGDLSQLLQDYRAADRAQWPAWRRWLAS